MPYDEFLGWQQFFGERPIGWREDDRTMKLLQAQGVKERPGNIFYSLKAMQDAEARRETISAEEDKARGVSKTPKGLKGSMMFSLMSGAVGGDKID
jgi:hypothetical protein